MDETELMHNEQEEASEMDDQSLLGVIEQFESESYGFSTGDLANQRAYAIERYLAEPYGNEIEGRSSVVDTGFRDTVETAIPQILRVFLAGDEVVQFDPSGPEDEAQAKQETEYVNHVILQKNDAFNVFSTWFRDALMSKVGYVKAYWDTRQDVLRETYKGLPDDSLAVIAADQTVQIVRQSSYPDPYYVQPPMPAPEAMQQGMTPQMPPPPPMLHDVEVRRVHQCGYVKVDNVPPEEIRVHRSLRTIGMQDCIFVQHSTRRTLSECRMMGLEVDDYVASSTGADPENDEIQFARDRFGDETSWGDDSNSSDPATRQVWVRESYIRVDVDGDGIAELRKVIHIGRQILVNEETDVIPFAAVTPIIFPHKHVGIGFDDLCDMPSQVATAIQRQYLDGLYLTTNGRYGVDVNKVNVDDMLVSRPGGIVRTDGPPGEALFPFTHPDTGPAALQGLEWATNWLQTSTGVVKDAAAISPDILNNSTASGVAQMISAQQSRIEAVTRSFASGVKELCGIVHALTLKNSTAAEKVKIAGQWTTVDPREWVKRSSMSITVGLGSGTKETRVAALMQLAQAQEKGLQIGICQPANLYHTGTLLTTEMGYKNSDQFWTDPAKNPPQPPQPDPRIQVAQMQLQADQQKTQATMTAEQQKFAAQQQADVQKFQAEQAAKQQQMAAEAAAKEREQQNALILQQSNDQRQAQLDAQQHERELQRMAMEDQFKRDQMDREFAFKQWETQAKLEADMRTAAMKPAQEPKEAKSSGGDHLTALVAAALAPKKATKNPDGSWSSRIDG